MVTAWSNDFPRLYELYLESDTTSPTNYFNKFTDELYRQDVLTKYKELEQVLQQLDDNAWKELKLKACKYVTAKHSCRAYEQLFNTLSEAKGYLYLKSEGCTKIHFIPEKDTPTPDLRGRCGNKGTLMEIKAINPSDDEINWIRTNSDLSNRHMTAREVHSGLPNLFKSKIKSTIDTAKEQLMSYPCNGMKRRVVYLVIKLDLQISLNSSNFVELENYLQQLDTKQLEVKYCYRGW